MTTPKKPSSKSGAPAKRKTSRKKRRSFSALGLAGLLILAGFTVYWVCSLVSTRLADKKPLFEIYPSTGTEAKVEQTDMCIYNALLALNVRPADVIFKSVVTKKDKEEQWTFSELEIQVSRTTRPGQIKDVLSKQLSRIVPTSSLRFASGPQNQVILELSAHKRPTHRLIFVTKKEEKPLVIKRPRPLVAIIIDDLGYDKNMASKFLELDVFLSFSVIPYSPFQKSIAAAVHRSGQDVLLHLPMEPLEYPQVDPGKGTLLCSMGPDELLDQLRKDLDEVPFVVGVNNHMGSRLTQDSSKMRQIFTVLKKRNLFFIDSFTNPNSRCEQTAELLQLKFARRHVFLDNVQEANAIRFQLKRLLTIADTQGQVIGIAHPHAVTWRILKQELPHIREKADLVKVSELVGWGAG